jgi:hypothetical protein
MHIVLVQHHKANDCLQDRSLLLSGNVSLMLLHLCCARMTLAYLKCMLMQLCCCVKHHDALLQADAAVLLCKALSCFTSSTVYLLSRAAHVAKALLGHPGKQVTCYSWHPIRCNTAVFPHR